MHEDKKSTERRESEQKRRGREIGETKVGRGKKRDNDNGEDRGGGWGEGGGLREG